VKATSLQSKKDPCLAKEEEGKPGKMRSKSWPERLEKEQSKNKDSNIINHEIKLN
jgi:hypothetical protein